MFFSLAIVSSVVCASVVCGRHRHPYSLSTSSPASFVLIDSRYLIQMPDSVACNKSNNAMLCSTKCARPSEWIGLLFCFVCLVDVRCLHVVVWTLAASERRKNLRICFLFCFVCSFAVRLRCIHVVVWKLAARKTIISFSSQSYLVICCFGMCFCMSVPASTLCLFFSQFSFAQNIFCNCDNIFPLAVRIYLSLGTWVLGNRTAWVNQFVRLSCETRVNFQSVFFLFFFCSVVMASAEESGSASQDFENLPISNLKTFPEHDRILVYCTPWMTNNCFEKIANIELVIITCAALMVVPLVCFLIWHHKLAQEVKN